ncbi:MAG: hypothetical protein U1E64_13935 [Sphingomonadaceae bacterium]
MAWQRSDTETGYDRTVQKIGAIGLCSNQAIRPFIAENLPHRLLCQTIGFLQNETMAVEVFKRRRPAKTIQIGSGRTGEKTDCGQFADDGFRIGWP